MQNRGSLLAHWVALIAATVLGSAVALVAAYFGDGRTIAGTLAFAWPLALFPGAIAALVIAGPLMVLWSGWEIFVQEAPNDFNGLVFVTGLPPTLVLALAGGIALAARLLGREISPWPATFVLAPLILAALVVVR